VNRRVNLERWQRTPDHHAPVGDWALSIEDCAFQLIIAIFDFDALCDTAALLNGDGNEKL
jgi:hypothetical protein